MTTRSLRRGMLAALILLLMTPSASAASNDQNEPDSPAEAEPANDHTVLLSESDCPGSELGTRILSTDSSPDIKYVGHEVSFGAAIPFAPGERSADLRGVYEPSMPGELTWWNHRGCITPAVSGALYTEDLFPACARVRVASYYDSNLFDASHGVHLGANELTICPSDYGSEDRDAWVRGHASNLTNRVVVTFDVEGHRGWVTLATRTRTL